MPKDTKTLGNSKARACESLGFVHKKGCARVLTQPHLIVTYFLHSQQVRLIVGNHLANVVLTIFPIVGTI